MQLEPRIRVSALLRWQDRVLLCRHEKLGRGEYWLLPGGGVNSGESLVDALQVSALTGEGLDALRVRIADRFAERYDPVRLLLPYDEGGKLNELYALGAPIEQREDTSDGVLVVARLPRREIRRFARYLVAEARSEPARRAR